MGTAEWVESIDYFIGKGCEPANLIRIAVSDGAMWQFQADELAAHFGVTL